MTSDEPIYKVIESSVTAHCCFEASVIDTRKTEMLPSDPEPGEEQFPSYTAVCECFSVEDAEMIASALALQREIGKLKLGHSTGGQ